MKATWISTKDEWIKMQYIHPMEYYSAIKKNEIMPFTATWMQLEIIILNEIVRKKKTNITQYHLYAESKTWHKWTYLWNRLRDIKFWLLRGRGSGVRMQCECGVSRCKLIFIYIYREREWISNKVLLCSIVNYIQYLVLNHNGKEYEKECIYV